MSVIIKYPVKRMKYNGKSYFGEVKREENGFKPYGAGLYKLNENSFIMSEKVNNEDLNGMTIIGSGYSGKLTYTKNGFIYGPCIEFDDEKDIVFSYINEYNKKIKFTITISKDGTYYIAQYDNNGNFTNKVLSFKKGLFCLEYRLEEKKERTAVKEIKVGWNFKYPFVRMHLLPFKEASVAPAKIIRNGTSYTYRGGAQTNSFLSNSILKAKYKGDFDYVSFVLSRSPDFYSEFSKRDHEMFSDCTLNGYAVDYFDDGTSYFGEVFNNQLGGIGCKHYPKYDYLGYLDHKFLEPDRTGMKVYEDGIIEFGSFCYDRLIFEIFDDVLFIKSYECDKLRGKFYKLDLANFDIEEYDENNELSELFPFPEITEEMKVDNGKKATIRTKLTGYDLLDNEMRASLKNYKFNIPKINELEVTHYNNDKLFEVYVPNFVTRIKEFTFSGKDNIKHLYLPENLNKLYEHSLYGMKELTMLKFHENSKISELPSKVCTCPNLTSITIPGSVKLIKSEAFIKCSKLKRAYVYGGCKIEPGAFPKKCKIMIIDSTGKNLKNKTKMENQKSKIYNKSKKRRTSLSFDLSDFFRGVFDVLAFPFKMLFILFRSIFKILLYPFKKLFSLLPKSFKPTKKFNFSLNLDTNVFSIISIIVLIIAAAINFFKVNVAINEWATDNIDVITNLFGLHLVTLLTNLNTSSILINLLIMVAVIVFFVLDCVFNILVFVLFILYMILFFVIGFAYSLVVPLAMFIFAIVGLVKNRSTTNIIILILDICLIALFYIAIYM